MPFELSVDLTTLAILALVAFIAGFIDAIAGGGGLLTTPALLTAGLPPHLVLGTNKLSSTFGSATASFTFYRRKLFHPRQWTHAIVGTLVGALTGAVVAHYLPAEWLNKMLPVIVFACGVYLLFGGTPKAPLDSEAPIRKSGNRPRASASVSTTAWPAPARAPSGPSAACCSTPSTWSRPAAWRAA